MAGTRPAIHRGDWFRYSNAYGHEAAHDDKETILLRPPPYVVSIFTIPGRGEAACSFSTASLAGSISFSSTS
jgi:hypothetical protein